MPPVPSAAPPELTADCPSDDDAAGFVDGALPPARWRAFANHVDGCERCRRLVSALVAAGAVTREEPAPVDSEVGLRPGLALGRYALTRLLGRGSMAEVWAARDRELDREVALKLLRPRPGMLTSEGTVRLRREARAMARLNHPNVVAIYELGTDDDDRVFCAMELVNGTTLRRWLETPRTWREVVRVACAVARGVAAAHAVGLIHRDIKPENILIAADGRTLVSDFGLARPADLALVSDEHREGEPERAHGPSSEIRSLTMTGAIIGTPVYMAPEQLDGGRADARSDQFSFCVTVYEALFGARPFAGNTMSELAQSMQGGLPRLRPGGVPKRVTRCIARGLDTDPEARWPSITALADELERASRPRRRVQVMIGAAIAAVAAAGAMAIARAPETSHADAGAARGPRIAAAWNPTKALILRARFLASGAPGAGARAAASIRDLDAYREAWMTQWNETSAALSSGAAKTAGVLERRLRCLDRAARATDGLVRMLLTAHPVDVNRAPQLVGRLASVASCLDTDRLAWIDAHAAADAMPADHLLQVVARRQIAARRAEALQRKYRGTCASSASVSCADLFGQPVAEDVPLEGGMVSYFARQVCDDGYPISDTGEAGVRRLISGSAIYDGPTGTHEVHGCIYQMYAATLGGPAGLLGFPISDEYEIPQGRESDFQYGSITFDRVTGDVQLHLGDGKLDSAMNSDRQLELYEWSSDGQLVRKTQSAQGEWQSWSSRGGDLSGRPVVVRTSDARLEVFARNTDKELHHTWQRTPGGVWSGWASLGAELRGDPAIAQRSDGGLELFVRGTDDALWRSRQADDEHHGWSSWDSLGGFLTSSPAVALDRDHRLAVFARGHGELQWIHQLDTGAWSGWKSLGGQLAGNPVVQRASDGRLAVFATASDGVLWQLAQRASGDGWEDWTSLGGRLASSPAAGIGPGGRLELFAVGSDAALWHTRQDAPGGAWSPWASLGGSFVGDPDVWSGPDGELRVFAQTSDGEYRESRQCCGTGWSGWTALSPPPVDARR